MKGKSTKEIDAQMRRKFKSEQPPVPADPWFVRKTLNRLPPRRQGLFSLPEVAAFMLVILVVGFVVVNETGKYLAADSASAYNPTMLIASLAMLVIMTLYWLASLVRRML